MDTKRIFTALPHIQEIWVTTDGEFHLHPHNGGEHIIRVEEVKPEDIEPEPEAPIVSIEPEPIEVVPEVIAEIVEVKEIEPMMAEPVPTRAEELPIKKQRKNAKKQ